MEEKREYYYKNHGEYELKFTSTDVPYMYRILTDELIAKKINKCTYIAKISRRPLYNGFDEITVFYNGYESKTIYTIKSV